MKTFLPLLAAASALLLAGCGPSSSTPAPAAVGTPASPREIDITAGDTMKYSTTSIEAQPGETLTVVLTNNGSTPVEVMAHNWVLLKAGSDPAAFDSAALTAKDTGYLPPSLSGEVLAHIDLLGPRKSGQVTFQAPTTPGNYPFLCTFPAHFQNGMQGVLTVK
jgi:azurin